MSKAVIYVEDEPDDAFFMERVFQQSVPKLGLKVLKSGTEAKAFFAAPRKPETESEMEPALVLLDLNLPGPSGLDVLQGIRSRQEHKNLPVIMYTSSNQPVDIAEAYKRGANGYVVKAQSVDRLREIISALTGFWIRDNQFPTLV